MNQVVDLRSDTVTEPTEEMRLAMRAAEVGDDYYGDDPTVRRLEELAATTLGKPAALFVTSGTMGNCVSVFTLTQPGQLVLAEARAHIVRAERAHLAVISGVQVLAVQGSCGVISEAQIEAALAMYPEATVYPRPSLICIENTNNASGGTCWSLEQMQELRSLADRRGLKIYLDGARIFNAAVAQGVEARQLARDADALSFCLTKGLSCPFGSLVVGEADFIREARLVRQMVGGGMRQAGIMAAAGIVALNSMIDRLAEDHSHARLLAERLVELGCTVDLATVQTNMVFVSGPPAWLSMDEWVRGMRECGVRVNAPSGGFLRFVTHRGISRADVLRTVEITADLQRAASASR